MNFSHLIDNISAGKGLKIVLYILLINALLALVYLVLRIVKKDYQKGFIMSIFILLTPPVGVIYLMASWLIYQIYFKRHPGILSMEELSLSRKMVELIEKDNLESAFNKVPIEEALIITDNKNTRQLLLDILKEDTEEYINTIYKAKDSSDSEVAHYAATAIADIMNKFKAREKVLREMYHTDMTDSKAGMAYRDFLSNFLMKKIFPKVEQERYAGLLEDLIINLKTHTPLLVTGEEYNKLISIFMDLEKTDEAKVWVEKVLENPHKDLASYKACLKFYYTLGARDKFLDLFEELKKSSIRLDQETLEITRFYSHKSIKG